MAEMSYLWNNPGTGDSPAAPGYTDDILMNTVFKMILNGTGNQGVLRGWLNELAVTDGGGLSINIATGGASVYGFWFENDAILNLAVPNNSTVEVVVRASWAAFTARIAQVAALVQTPTVTYDIPLATVTTVAGAVTVVTDTRDFCEFTGILPTGGVTADSIQANAVTIGKMANQTRWITRALNELMADGTTPATLTYGGRAY
jgi:hypothetical protein